MALVKGMTAAVFWLAALAAFGAAVVLTERKLMAPAIGELLLDGNLNDAQNSAMRHISDLGKLMISWSVAILGAIAVSARQVKDWTGMSQGISFAALGLSFVACVLSVWCGMLVLDSLIQSLSLEQDPLGNTTMHLFRRWQYIFFVAGLILFVSSWLNIGLFLTGDKKPEA